MRQYIECKMQRRGVDVDYDPTLFVAEPAEVSTIVPTTRQTVNIYIPESRLRQVERWCADTGRSRSSAFAELIAIGSDPDFE